MFLLLFMWISVQILKVVSACSCLAMVYSFFWSLWIEFSWMMAEEASSTLHSAMSENIYRVSRRIKRTEQTVYNALRSIYEDSLFVLEIQHLWMDMPLLANLRCGLWYAPKFDGTCYFKSTDGHNGNWSFSTIRLNLHVANLAGSVSATLLFTPEHQSCVAQFWGSR